MKFLEFGLPEALCHTLERQEITTPTPVQEKAIPLVLAGKDLIVSARTGTGKTLAFALPLLSRLMDSGEGTVLVLVPTRELATQVHSVFEPFLKALRFGPPAVLIGGVSFGPQVQALRKNPRVIIATPGRLLDHLQNGKFRMGALRALVLDEADRMLDMGFAPQVRAILRYLEGERQTLLFTATLPSDLRRMIKDLMKYPEQIFVDPPSSAGLTIEQKMLEVTSDGKQDALLEAVGRPVESVLVFARTKRRTDRVARFLDDYGVATDRIHGDRSQAQRQKAIDAFRAGRVKVLVATDIAARGLDIPSVELVVNYDLPEAKEDYVHRIGRTGRAGAKGEALSFVLPEERRHWAGISGERAAKPERRELESAKGTAPTRPERERPQRERSEGDFRPHRKARHERPDRESRHGNMPRPGERYRRDRRPSQEFRGEERRGHQDRTTVGGEHRPRRRDHRGHKERGNPFHRGSERGNPFHRGSERGNRRTGRSHSKDRGPALIV